MSNQIKLLQIKETMQLNKIGFYGSQATAGLPLNPFKIIMWKRVENYIIILLILKGILNT